MAVYDYDDDDDFDGNDLPKKLRAQIKELQKEKATLQERYEELLKESRTKNVREIVEAKNLNPKIVALIPPDADVEEWLNEYGDIFGSGTQQADDPALSAEAAESTRQSAAEQGAKPPINDVLAAVQNAQSMDELMDALRRA